MYLFLFSYYSSNHIFPGFITPLPLLPWHCCWVVVVVVVVVCHCCGVWSCSPDTPAAFPSVLYPPLIPSLLTPIPSCNTPVGCLGVLRSQLVLVQAGKHQGNTLMFGRVSNSDLFQT